MIKKQHVYSAFAKRLQAEGTKSQPFSLVNPRTRDQVLDRMLGAIYGDEFPTLEQVRKLEALVLKNALLRVFKASPELADVEGAVLREMKPGDLLVHSEKQNPPKEHWRGAAPDTASEWRNPNRLKTRRWPGLQKGKGEPND